jgi:membrane-associated phospholipid phosphatase
LRPDISEPQRAGALFRSDLPEPSALTGSDRTLLDTAALNPAAQPGTLYPTIIVSVAVYVVALGASSLLGLRAHILNIVPPLAGPGAFLCLYGRVAFPQAVRSTRLVEATFIVVVLGLSLACLSYVGAMTGLPLRDQDMMSLDRHLGFDWLQMVQALDRRPLALAVLDAAYATFTTQLIGTVLVLVLVGRTRELDRFFLTFVCASLLAEAASVLIPTLGPMSTAAGGLDFAHLPTLGRTTAEIVLKLRDGTLRDIDFAALDGIISFPSLHAAVAVIVPFSLRWNRHLFCLAATLDAVMLVSAVPSGNHYVVDIIGGVGVAALAIVCSGPIQRSLDRLVSLRSARKDWERASNDASVRERPTSPMLEGRKQNMSRQSDFVARNDGAACLDQTAAIDASPIASTRCGMRAAKSSSWVTNSTP